MIPFKIPTNLAESNLPRFTLTESSVFLLQVDLRASLDLDRKAIRALRHWFISEGYVQTEIEKDGKDLNHELF